MFDKFTVLDNPGADRSHILRGTMYVTRVELFKPKSFQCSQESGLRYHLPLFHLTIWTIYEFSTGLYNIMFH